MQERRTALAPAQSWDLGGLPPPHGDGASSLTQSLDPAQQCPFKYKSEPLPFYKALSLWKESGASRIRTAKPGVPKTRSSTPDETSLTDHHLKKATPRIPAYRKEKLRLGGFHLSTVHSSKRKAILGSWGWGMERDGGLGLRLLKAAA